MARKRSKATTKPERDEKVASNRKATSAPQVAATAVQLLTGGNISYGYPVGTSIEDAGTLKGMVVDTSAKSMPGIMTYYLDPHIGVSDGPNSKVNLAAHRLYTSYIYANGRSPGYDVPDGIIAPLAVGQVASFYTFAVRAYNVLNSFSSFNRMLPKALADAMLINYDDFKRHASDFAHWLEDYRLKLQSLFVPNNLPIIQEWMSAYADVYVDEPNNPKAQLVLFAPKSFLIYAPTKYDTGGALSAWEYFQINSSTGLPKLYTYEEFTGYGDAMIDTLVYDQDINRIMADIMLSYGPTSVQDLITVSLGMSIELKYDPVVLATIHNSTPMCNMTYRNAPGTGESFTASSADVFQQDGVLYHTPVWEGPKLAIAAAVGARLFDSPVAEVNPILNISMARMTVEVPSVVTPTILTTRTSYGYLFDDSTDVGQCKSRSLGVYTIGRMAISSADGENGFTYAILTSYIPPTTTAMTNWLTIGIDKFKDHPIFDVYGTLSTGNINAMTNLSIVHLKGWYGDVSFYTILQESDLYKMHDTYILAQLSAGLRE